jgi:hypothetical protein
MIDLKNLSARGPRTVGGSPRSQPTRTIKEKLLEMAARFQAKADEDDNADGCRISSDAQSVRPVFVVCRHGGTRRRLAYSPASTTNGPTPWPPRG